MIAWRKFGKAHQLSNQGTELWVRSIGRNYHLIQRTPTGWATLGVYRTLRDAQHAGNGVLAIGEGV